MDESKRQQQREDRLKRDKDDIELVSKFKKLIEVDQKPGSNSDMIKCLKCGKSMGIKKWARLAAKDGIVCPGCGTKYKLGTKVKIVLKEKSRFKVEGAEVDKSKASVTTDSEGKKHYKETVNVKVSPTITKN